MKKEQIKGGIPAVIAALILLYAGIVYRAGGFGAGFSLMLAVSVAAVPPLLLIGYRRLGSLPIWLAMAAALPILYFGSRDAATSVLVWALCCGTPLAVTLFWPGYKEIKPMTAFALPAAGAIWLGGTLLYCKLHFGSWALSAMSGRIAGRLIGMVDRMEALSRQVYGETMAEQLSKLFTLYRESAASMGFLLLLAAVYALFGIFFVSLFAADRSVPAEQRWLGSWETLIPGPGISWLYMGGYLLVMLVSDAQVLTVNGVFNLFGFFYVFTALYQLLQWMRKRKVPPTLRGIVLAVLFFLAFLTAGGSLFSPYSILMYVGWWIATSVRRMLQMKQ